MNARDQYQILERAAALRRVAHRAAPVTAVRTDVAALLEHVRTTRRLSTRAIAEAQAAIERSHRVRQVTQALRQAIAERLKAGRG